MSGKDKKPDAIYRYAPPIGPQSTTLKKGKGTYTGYGWTKERADKHAGDKYRRGEKDKK